jgi:nucleotide-binding universal stress UspA family protein
MEVFALTVSYNPETAWHANRQPWYAEWSDKEKDRVEKHHEQLRSILAGSCQSLTLLRRSGDIVRSILDVSAELEADLIVLGARGHSMIRRIVLGSISDSVATLATSSVLVVRPGGQRAEKTRTAERILVGYDGSAGSREAVAELLELNWKDETEVIVASVAEQSKMFFDDTFSSMAVMYEPREVERLRGVVERIASQIASVLPRTVTEVARGNHVGDTLVELAAEHEVDMIVVGDTGHGKLGELIVGSTTKYVLRHAPCTVWISRHHLRGDTWADVEEAGHATTHD